MAQITTIHNLSSISTADINTEAEFMVNNDPTAIVRANKVTLAQIKSDLANKDLTNLTTAGEDHFANPALSNLSNSGNIVSAKASMPSDTYDEIPVAASGTEYTAPSDGWYYFGINASAAGATINITCSMTVTQIAHASGNQLRRIFPVKKGDKVTISYTSSAASLLRFYYAVGSVSEAS